MSLKKQLYFDRSALSYSYFKFLENVLGGIWVAQLVK